MFNQLLTYLSFTEPLKYCQQDHAKRLRKSQTMLEKWRTKSINDVPPVQVQELGNKTQLLLQPSWHYGRSGSVTASFPIILSNLLVEQNLLFFFNEHSYACCSGHSQCQNMPVHYHISEKLKVMNNLVKWIWLRENHAGKLKWFVLTSLPPKTFSKPTPSWGTNSDKNMFSKEKKTVHVQNICSAAAACKTGGGSQHMLYDVTVTDAVCLLRICGASSDLKASVHRLLLAYALIFLLCSSTLASLSQHW